MELTLFNLWLMVFYLTGMINGLVIGAIIMRLISYRKMKKDPAFQEILAKHDSE